MLRTILFDLDNTLVDRNRSLRNYATRFAHNFSGMLRGLDAERAFLVMAEVDNGGHISREEFFRKLAQVLPWSSEPDVESLRSHWFATFPGCSQPMEGVHETLEKLRAKGITLGIVTNGKAAVQNEKIDVIGVRPQMKTVIVSETVQLKKPDARIFRLALSELNTTAQETWFVGDHPEKDIAGAAAVGLTTVWIRHNATWCREDCQPNYELDRLAIWYPSSIVCNPGE